jgi:hypothetical protein
VVGVGSSFISELDKAIEFLGPSVGCGFGVSSPEEKVKGKKVGDCMGNVTGPLSFAAAVRSPPSIHAFGGRILGSQEEVASCEEEQFPIKERSCAIVRLAVDCSSWERNHFDPVGKDLCVDGSSVRKGRKCRTRDCDV